MKLIFMGTPDFAVPTLKALNEAGHQIAGVFTQPDKAVGRKQIITPPPVKRCAIELGIDVYQPNTLKDDEVQKIVEEIAPDAIVVVAYGKLLPERMLNVPKYGCINGHASLLPRHRGASPIQWSIVSGDTKTGVTTMLMEKGLDTGDMLLSSETPIADDETAESLHDRLSLICAELMVKTLTKIENDEIVPIKQDDALSTYAPIINKEMGYLTFEKNADEICCLIRGFNPWPAAYFHIDGKRMKVYSAVKAQNTDAAPSTVISADQKLVIACGGGTSVSLCELQPEGSKRMSAEDYLKGHSVRVGTVLNKDE